MTSLGLYCQAPRRGADRRAGDLPHAPMAPARMTNTIPIKKFDGLPPALVRPHRSGEGSLLGIFDCGVLKMARGQLAFKQSDVTRVLRAVSAAGQLVQRVEI